MPDPTTTPSSTAHLRISQVEHVFPTPPRDVTPDHWLRINGRSSPAPGKLMSMHFQRAQSTPPEITHDSRFRSVTRGATGDLPDVAGLENSWQRLHLSKKKSQYYSDAFAYREPNNTAKERVARDSVVMAEVKLNCCLESEQEFLIDLSFRLSEIYQRPASCIMVMVATEIAMLIGGNSEPAYHMIITALPSEIAATKNKRSAHLIQDFMLDTLQINPRRGVVRFEAVAEENLATNGVTALQEIEHLESHAVEEDGFLRAISRQKSRRSKKSTIPVFADRGKTPTPLPQADTPPRLDISGATGDTRSTTLGGTGKKKVKRRQSILALFRK